ncbi:MAG: TPM domain-containing protein [bacterium]|nr:TPM domain-containing protein [bacterium]MDD5755829.1 TPM domain-containing protein [bacterium]
MPSRKLLLKILLIGVLSFFCATALALEVPEKPISRVNDNAGMFSSQTVMEMSQNLGDFEAQKGIQIVVATFPSLEGDNLEDFSIRLAEKWKIGQKGKDNGVIIVIFKNDRKIRIEVGYGLEAVLTDAICSQIIAQNIGPNFKRENYDAGIKEAIIAILNTLNEERSGHGKKSTQDSSGTKTNKIFAFFFLVLIIIIIILKFISATSYHISGRGGYGGGFWGGGGGGFSGGGGGFSGGGGSFGGGGSSGGW